MRSPSCEELFPFPTVRLSSAAVFLRTKVHKTEAAAIRTAYRQLRRHRGCHVCRSTKRIRSNLVQLRTKTGPRFWRDQPPSCRSSCYNLRFPDHHVEYSSTRAGKRRRGGCHRGPPGTASRKWVHSCLPAPAVKRSRAGHPRSPLQGCRTERTPIDSLTRAKPAQICKWSYLLQRNESFIGSAAILVQS